MPKEADISALNSARSHCRSSQIRSANIASACTSGIAITLPENQLAAERALTARLRARLADRDTPEA